MRRCAPIPALLAACASIGPVPAEPVSPDPAPSTKRRAQERADRGSPFRVGDYVVYRYEGAYTKHPVVLRERILEKNVFRLVIQVDAERGSERRRWIQVVTDTAENRKKNVVDELYEVKDGTRQRLENTDNRDLLRLYEWTLPPCEGGGRAAGETELELSVAGARFSCVCKEALVDCAGKPSRLETCECPEFTWTHAGGEARAQGDAQLIWKVSVERFGNVKER